MNPQTTSPQSNVAKATVQGALTRALRASIESDKLAKVLFAAGATKLSGTPTEVLRELAAAQTAAWLVGSPSGPTAGPVPSVAQAEALELAMAAVDTEALAAAGEMAGLRGNRELERLRSHLVSNLALTAFEATRFALAEDRPVDHNCIAIGGASVARNALQAGLPEAQRVSINR